MPFEPYQPPLPDIIEDALDRLRIIPVAADIVAERKAIVLAECLRKAHSKFQATHTRWETILVAPGLSVLRTGLLLHATADKSPAPRKLVKLAQKVEREVADAVFTLEYCDNDPILYVTYNNGLANLAPRTVCLGIWENGKIVAIAKKRKDPTGYWLLDQILGR